VIHRDVKPENIIFLVHASVVVARWLHSDEAGWRATTPR